MSSVVAKREALVVSLDAPISAEARRENPARGIMIAVPIALILWAATCAAIYFLWLPFMTLYTHRLVP